MSGLPGIIQVVSPSQESRERVVQDLLQGYGEELSLRKGQQYVPWTLRTKYYTARVEIQLGSWRDGEEETEAVVLALEPVRGHGPGLEFLKEVEALFQDRQPDVRVLAWYGAEGGEGWGEMEALTSWCIEHEVELVPMEKGEEDQGSEDWEEKEEEGEKWGRDRVIEVLECHMWSSAVMIPRSKGVKREKEEEEEKEDFGAFQSSPSIKDELDTRLDRLSLPGEEEAELEGMDLEHAFAQVLSFKDHWEELSMEERRKRADQIAESFVEMLDEEEEE
ncbi:MAG: hypothetical protein DHS80DRAFT_30257 [Piptocephalis tieghemiana]|nr:MAG: hypothetical protein DHS80DRAFT_30257 [Piptocephalis tieghemiana]